MIRKQTGTSLVELLVTTTVMAFVGTAIFGLFTADAGLSRKLANKLDAIDSIRTGIDNISRDVRQARTFGDIYGNTSGQRITTAGGVASANKFPCSTDPLWGNQPAPTGWTGPWPITMNATNMIVQIPVFDANGFPLALNTAWYPNTWTASQDDLETHVYQIIADPDGVNHPNEFILQEWKFPGVSAANVAAGAKVVPAAIGPIVLVKGIIGPTTMAGNLQIFQLIDSTNPNNPPVDPASINPTNLANYGGLVVNMEVKKFGNTNTAVAQSSNIYEVVPIKTEVFLRNNILSTTSSNGVVLP